MENTLPPAKPFKEPSLRLPFEEQIPAPLTHRSSGNRSSGTEDLRTEFNLVLLSLIAFLWEQFQGWFAVLGLQVVNYIAHAGNLDATMIKAIEWVHVVGTASLIGALAAFGVMRVFKEAQRHWRR